MFGSTWLQLYENERIYNILELRKRRDELQRYESPRLSDKNKQTWSWFAIHYLLCYFENLRLTPISTTLKSLFKRSDKKEVNLRHDVLSFKLFWNSRFQTCLVWHYVQTTLYWYFNLPRKLLCLFSEMYLTLPEYSLLNYLY